MRSDGVFGTSMVLSLALAACGGGQGGASTQVESTTSSGSSGVSAAPAATNGAITIVPLHIRSGDAHAGDLALNADGTITANGQLVARVEGTRIVGPTGETLLEAGDGYFTVPGHDQHVPLTNDGQVGPPDDQLVVNADGTLDEVRNGGAPHRGPFAFDPIPANDRRTAAVVTALLLMQTRMVTTSSAGPSNTVAAEAPAPEATASASPSPAPATTPHHGRTTRHH